MAATGEANGGEARKAAAEERTAQLAREAGEKAVASARELLDRHRDLVGPTLIDFITSRESQRAEEAARKAREEGRMNDNNSKAPGLTAFITKAGYEGLTEALGRDDVGPYMEGYVGSMQPVDPEGAVYSLRLPSGTYGMGMGSCQFYGEASLGDGYPTDRENPFTMPYDMVIRIEGDSGELWQNANFTPGGGPVER
jgi:hypothetical protein